MTGVGVQLHRPVPVGNGRLKAARVPSGAWLPGDFLSIDNQPLQVSPILQLDDMSFVLGLPRGFKHSEPPACRETLNHISLGAVALTAPRSLLGFTFPKRAATCARES